MLARTYHISLAGMLRDPIRRVAWMCDIFENIFEVKLVDMFRSSVSTFSNIGEYFLVLSFIAAFPLEVMRRTCSYLLLCI